VKPRRSPPLLSAAHCSAHSGSLAFPGTHRAVDSTFITSLGLAVLIVGRVLPDFIFTFRAVVRQVVVLMNARLPRWPKSWHDTQWLLTNYFLQTRLFLFLNVLPCGARPYGCCGRAALAPCFRSGAAAAILGVMLTALSKDARLFGALIAACVLLMARTAYTYQTHDWNLAIGFPDLIGED